VTVVLLVLVLVVASAAALAGFRADLVEQLDAQLRRVAVQADRAYRAGVLEAFAEGDSDPDLDLFSDDVDEVGDLAAQLVVEDGGLAYASPSLEGDAPLWSPGDDLGPSTVRSGSLGSMRIVVIPLDSSWLVLGQPLAPIDDDVSALRHVLLLALVPTMLLVGLITWAAVGRALAPVVAAAEREERLLADVSHELRSPIAGLRALVESSGGSDGEQERADLLASITRLETLTSQLLRTAQVAGAPAPARPVDVDEIVERESRRLAIGTTVHIDTSGVVAGQVVGVERDLESAVSNLMTNAVRHARREVRLAVAEVDGWVEVVVADDGPGIAPGDRERVFERFTRLDEARGREDGGAGLGLAIARDVVTAHGGTIVVTDAPGGGATFVVRLPAAAPGREGRAAGRRSTRRPVAR
jgi:signal transduction histidine kinase